MKITFFSTLLAVAGCAAFAFCHKGVVPPGDINTGTVFSLQADQSGHPLVNITLINSTGKDSFNATQPSAMVPLFEPEVQSKIMTLYPGYTTNVLGLTAPQLARLFTSDVLSVSMTGKTTYYDGTNVMTGRWLADNVVDDHFMFIYGGPNGTDNPGLTSDHVPQNDKPFLNTFPYEAAPW